MRTPQSLGLQLDIPSKRTPVKFGERCVEEKMFIYLSQKAMGIFILSMIGVFALMFYIREKFKK